VVHRPRSERIDSHFLNFSIRIFDMRAGEGQRAFDLAPRSKTPQT
jgi:hypothetical protein